MNVPTKCLNFNFCTITRPTLYAWQCQKLKMSNGIYTTVLYHHKFGREIAEIISSVITSDISQRRTKPTKLIDTLCLSEIAWSNKRARPYIMGLAPFCPIILCVLVVVVEGGGRTKQFIIALFRGCATHGNEQQLRMMNG